MPHGKIVEILQFCHVVVTSFYTKPQDLRGFTIGKIGRNIETDYTIMRGLFISGKVNAFVEKLGKLNRD